MAVQWQVKGVIGYQTDSRTSGSLKSFAIRVPVSCNGPQSRTTKGMIGNVRLLTPREARAVLKRRTWEP